MGEEEEPGGPHESGGDRSSDSGSRPSAISDTARVPQAAVVGVPVLGPLARGGREGAIRKGRAGGPFRCTLARLKESCLGTLSLLAGVDGRPLPLPARGKAHCHSARPPRHLCFLFFQLQSLTVRAASATRGFSPRLLRTAVLRPQLLPFAGRRDNSKRWITRLVCR